MATAKKEIHVTTLADNSALLLAEACKLNKEGKVIEKRISEIKVALGKLKLAAGKYVNDAGDTLGISETPKFEDLNPKTVFDYLKKNKLMVHFPNVVKVQMTELKKVVPELVIKRWQKPLDPIQRWTFK